jgi:hypothetical protein
LVERLRGTQEVRRFEPARLHPVLSSLLEVWDSIGFTLGGLVAGEGSFIITKRGTFASGAPNVRFVFQVALATRDRGQLEALRRFLGYGSIYEQPSRRDGHQPMSVFTIASKRTALPLSPSPSALSSRQRSDDSSRFGEMPFAHGS